jgi:hypothetical protein
MCFLFGTIRRDVEVGHAARSLLQPSGVPGTEHYKITPDARQRAARG